MATTNGFQSYSIGSDMSLTYTSNVTTPDCENANHIAVSSVSPYTVFAITYSSCPTLALSVDENGALASNWANASYDGTSYNIHGGSVSLEGDFFYSADGKSLFPTPSHLFCLRQQRWESES